MRLTRKRELPFLDKLDHDYEDVDVYQSICEICGWQGRPLFLNEELAKVYAALHAACVHEEFTDDVEHNFVTMDELLGKGGLKLAVEE